MHRFTVSIEPELAEKFDKLMKQRGYLNRSEAFRDLLRRELAETGLSLGATKHCVASLSYVYNHHERQLASRLTSLLHDHHDLAVSTMHVHLDHENCIESVILQGQTSVVTRFADQLMAEKGVRHGQINIVPVELKSTHKGSGKHIHLHPET
ncbi:MAG: nickel-responsive transcriptional regulator NikR [Pseudomonadota bacterium]